MDRSHEVTALLARIEGGDCGGHGRLLELVYAELQDIARARMRRERRGHTLQATALIHEAWIKLDVQPGQFRDRVHFLAAASRAMRQILVDHARARQTARRGGDAKAMPLDEILLSYEHEALGVLELDGLLVRLAEVDPKLPPVVELKFFGDMTNGEVAEALGTSERTVERRWKLARGWLRRETEKDGDSN